MLLSTLFSRSAKALLVLVAAPALALAHSITSGGAVYNAATHLTTFTYSVTSGAQPAISHWMIVVPESCGVAIKSASEAASVGKDPTTSTYGIKFDTGYGDGATRTVVLTLNGNWSSGTVDAVVKAGSAPDVWFRVAGPVCGGTPPAPNPLTVTCPSGADSLVGPKWNDPGQSYATIPLSALPTFGVSGGVTPTTSTRYVLDGATSFVPVSTGTALQFPIGTTVVTFTATSAATNETKSCNYTVVVDYAGPRFRNAPAANSPYVVPSCSRVVTFGKDLFVSSAGEIVEFQSTPSAGTTFAIGTTPVAFTVKDAVGNTTTGTLLVEVTDKESPFINVPANIVAELDAGQCYATVNFATPLVTDCNLDTVTFSPASGSRFPVGNTTVTITATDTAGNPPSSATFVVTVKPDTQKPVITNLPANQVLATAPGACAAEFSFTPSASDNCPGVTVTSSWAGGPFPKGVTTVTVTATDAAGNSDSKSFTVTVQDKEAPTLTVPARLEQATAAGQCAARVEFAVFAADNCPGAIAVAVPASGSLFPKGETLVTVTATDAAGNQTVRTFPVVVVDRETPVLTVPENIVVSTAPGACSAPVTFSVTATDNCPGSSVVVSPASGAVFAKGETLVTATATDAAGNTTVRTFTVTVKDTEAPVIQSPLAPVVAYVPGQTSALIAATTPTATDNCAIASLTFVRSDGATSLSAPFPIGTTTITWTAVDTSGNLATTTQTITVANRLGAGGGLTIGFWSNKNGQSFVTEASLTALRAANLRNADGSQYDPATAADLGKWLTSAKATNMANMLSAQFTALTNNVAYRTQLSARGVGGVSATALIYAPGTRSANAWGVAQVTDVLAEANASLGANALTVSASATRSYQEALKNAIDAANNNLNFLVLTP